ncbi:MAG: hypothetical protein CMC35_06780 [Flavobacteriaceae bacterium]|nr:hypothetical protein [Flavobacteriaceae bacterium]|tara:strand:- start:47416 stop:48219 length:804 start_codon:yes stop_codon:yes gene_type:complete
MINRHTIKDNTKGLYAPYFRTTIPKIVGRLEKIPSNAGSFFKQAYDAIGDSVVLGESKKERSELLRAATDLGLNTFRNAQNDAKVSFQFLEKEFPVATKPSTAYIDPISWTRYFYCAVIINDRKAIEELVGIPESIMKKANLQGDRVDFVIVKFLKGLYKEDASIDTLLKEALLLSDPKENKKDRAAYLDYLKFPELDVYRAIFSGKQDDFNKTLAEAVTDHKTFWSTDKNANAPEGWVSFPLWAACLIAKDSKNFEITVETDYLPL